jgi:hypothetical protein
VLHQAAALVRVETQIAAAASAGAFDAAIALAVDAQDALGSHAVYDDDADADDHADAPASPAWGAPPEPVSVARLKVLHALRRRVAGALPGLRRDVDKALWRLVAGRTPPTAAAPTAASADRLRPMAAAAAVSRPLGGLSAHVGDEYAAIVRAYLHLDDLRVQVRQQHQRKAV